MKKVQLRTGVESIALSEDGLIAAGSSVGSVVVFDIMTLNRVHQMIPHSKGIQSLCFHRNYLAIGSYDRCVSVYDTLSWKQLKKLKDHTFWVSSVIFTSCYLVTASWDMKVILYNMKTWTKQYCLNDHCSAVFCVSANSKMLATASHAKIQVYQIDNQNEKPRKLNHFKQESIAMIRFHGNMLACVDKQRYVKIYDTHSWKVIKCLHDHERFITDILFHGTYLFTIALDQWLVIYNTFSWTRTKMKLKCVPTSIAIRRDILVLSTYKNMICTIPSAPVHSLLLLLSIVTRVVKAHNLTRSILEYSYERKWTRECLKRLITW